jgi:hypothetical protein
MSRIKARCGYLSLATCVLALGGLVRAEPPSPSKTDPALGIWKAAVPPRPVHGEFDNLDPVGVAAGAKIWADCSLNWIDPDDGARYCFSSGTSLEFFLDQPRYYLERARAAWPALKASSP